MCMRLVLEQEMAASLDHGYQSLFPGNLSIHVNF